MKFSELPEITGGRLVHVHDDRPVTHLLTDSRKIVLQPGAVFFAITGERHNGHQYLEEVYARGVTQFVVEHPVDFELFPLANILQVASAVTALQQMASRHRQQFHIPVIGITGSNGKTILKEWLSDLFNAEYAIVKNPGSYNSQVGVPLSVWQMQPYHQLGIFEAGISKPGEMELLEKIIRPTLGVFTTIGTAHDENFSNRKHKIEEKLKLFSRVHLLLYCADQTEVHNAIQAQGIPSLSWGRSEEANIRITSKDNCHHISTGSLRFDLTFPFTDKANEENALHAVAVMVHLGYPPQVIQQRIQFLKPVAMRLELKSGINQCQVIDDSYNNDLGGLQISLDFLAHQHQRKKKTLILSDIQQSGLDDETRVQHIAERVNTGNIQRLIGVGPVMRKYNHFFKLPSVFYSSTEEFIQNFNADDYANEIILIKGSRDFRLERITALLQQKLHRTVMEVNLGALVNNLNFFKTKLKPNTRVMVMVKAFAYGSGSIEVANLLQYHQVDYLGVAYADEGVDLRKHNIRTPIMVMNPTGESFQALLDYNLEPEVYSIGLLSALVDFLQGRPLTIHIKVDTGMHRLGFEAAELTELSSALSKHKNLHIASIFSHLAGSDEPELDIFSAQQASAFMNFCEGLTHTLGIRPLRHLINTSGILRLPQYHLDMVRLGIGLYGVDPSSLSHGLAHVATLKTVISQVRKVKSGSTIGYGRKGRVDRETLVATIAIGYADGFSRANSQGKGVVLVHGKRVPVLGNVCMDMTMVDVTGLPVKEGDEVIVFGEALSIQEAASRIGTIPYEVLTSTSARVKRIFVAEGM